MKRYSPGASMYSDYAYICNNCEIDDGRTTLHWKKPEFVLCLVCLKNLFEEYLCKELPKKFPILVNIRTFKKKKKSLERLRWKIWKRDNFTCKLCGARENLSIDHIIPVSKGGKTILKNLQTLCKKCNSSKGKNNG